MQVAVPEILEWVARFAHSGEKTPSELIPTEADLCKLVSESSVPDLVGDFTHPERLYGVFRVNTNWGGRRTIIEFYAFLPGQTLICLYYVHHPEPILLPENMEPFKAKPPDRQRKGLSPLVGRMQDQDAWLVDGEQEHHLEPDGQDGYIDSTSDSAFEDTPIPDAYSEEDGEAFWPAARIWFLPQLHAEWLALNPRPDHPLVPLVKAWQQRKLRHVEPDKRRDGILPAPLRHATQATLFGRLPSRLDRATPMGKLDSQAYLPGLEKPSSALIPALPISLWTASGGQMATRGQGAPIGQRLFFEVLMSVNQSDRNILRTPNVRLRDLVNWLWPKGWQRNRDMPRLQQGLIELDNMRVCFERGLWRLIAVNPVPAMNANLDDYIGIHVEHLPGSGRGPLIDRHLLRLFGLQSAPAWRSFLRLAYLWDEAKAKNGGFRIYATRPKAIRNEHGHLLKRVIRNGEERWEVITGHPGNPHKTPHGLQWRNGDAPQTDWRHPETVLDGEERHPYADRVPELDARDLATLGFDEKPTTGKIRRDRSAQTRKALESMEKQAAIVIEKASKTEGWRILEPPPRDTLTYLTAVTDLPNRRYRPT